MRYVSELELEELISAAMYYERDSSEEKTVHNKRDGLMMRQQQMPASPPKITAKAKKPNFKIKFNFIHKIILWPKDNKLKKKLVLQLSKNKIVETLV